MCNFLNPVSSLSNPLLGPRFLGLDPPMMMPLVSLSLSLSLLYRVVRPSVS